jgi:hypothetical protein
LILLLTSAVSVAAAEAADDAKAQAVRAMFQARMGYVNGLKQFERPVSAQELPRLTVRQGQFEVTPSSINPTPPQRMKVAGSDAIWVLGSTGMGVNVTSLEYLDAGRLEADGIWDAILSARADAVYVTVRCGTKSNAESFTISQRKNGFSVIFRNSLVAGAPLAGRILARNAESFEQFQQKFPDEFKRYVAPVIELLGFANLLKPGPADVYRVFKELQPSAETERQLLEIVAVLGSVDPALRTVASQRLEKLGPAGVLAALRLERSILTPEQGNRIDTFVRSQSCFVNEPQRLKHDPLFLVDCLEFDDMRVRQLALADLKVVLNRDVAIDLAADAQALGRAVADLRKQIADGLEKGSVKPIVTTQPAVRRPGVEIE